MTLAQAKKTVKELGHGLVLGWNQEWQEYTVRQKGAPEAQWYFTGDREDAVGTAKLMAADIAAAAHDERVERGNAKYFADRDKAAPWA